MSKPTATGASPMWPTSTSAVAERQGKICPACKGNGMGAYEQSGEVGELPHEKGYDGPCQICLGWGYIPTPSTNLNTVRDKS